MIADFRDLLAALVEAQARFLVVGAHALAAHGVPRMTGDLDLWVEPTAPNAARVWAALTRFGAPLESLSLTESDLVRPDQVIQLGLPPYRIDLLTGISGVGFAEAWEGRLDGTLFEVPVAFIGRAEFIRNKRAAGRPRDLDDIRSLGA
ncbi:MAG: hypothetical protein ABR551_03330 [Gemmatimonadales bacterium]